MRWWSAPSKSYTTCYLNFIQYSANYALILTRYYAWSLITDEIHLIPDIHSYKINITFHAFHLHTWYNTRWFTRHDTWTSWFCSQNFLIKKIFRWSYVITWRVNLLLSRLLFFSVHLSIHLITFLQCYTCSLQPGDYLFTQITGTHQYCKCFKCLRCNNFNFVVGFIRHSMLGGSIQWN